MDTFQVKENLKKAFGVDTDEDLALHITKTDLSDRESMLHAASVVWCYGIFYKAKERKYLEEIIQDESVETRYKLAIDAKEGYGYFDTYIRPKGYTYVETFPLGCSTIDRVKI